MQSAASANLASQTSLTGLTYIDSLVSGATAQGQFEIRVGGQFIDDATAATLRSNGYEVWWYNSEMGTFPTYVVKWGTEPTATPTPTPTATPTPTPTPTPSPTPLLIFSYDYRIAPQDLVSATGNTLNPLQNGVVVATTSDDGFGFAQTREFSVAGEYAHWLCSANGVTPTFGYYQNNSFVSTGLGSIQTQNGNC